MLLKKLLYRKRILQRVLKLPLPDELHQRLDYFLKQGMEPNLDNPTRFAEKIMWLKLNLRDPLIALCADKYAVRAHIAQQIGEQYLNKLVAVYDSVDDVDWDAFPDQFAMKCTHDCGTAVIVKDKSVINRPAIAKKMKKHLSRNFYKEHREWSYKDIQPRLLVEDYLKGPDSGLIDYKFLCFNGEAKLIQVIQHRQVQRVNGFFSTQWEEYPIEHGDYPSCGKDMAPPKSLELMTELSNKLARPFPFVRVDWYEVDARPIFGEMTFYPKAGLVSFTPEEWELRLGSYLQLPL